MEEMFVCSVRLKNVVSVEAKIKAANSQDARKKLTKEFRTGGFVENVDFVISLIEPLVDTPPVQPEGLKEDW